MNITEVFHYAQTDCIDQTDNIQRLTEKTNGKLTEKLKDKLRNKTGMPVRLIPADMDIRLLFLQGKTKKLSRIAERTDIFRITLPAVLPLNATITPEPLFPVTRNRSGSAELIPVSVSRTEESPRPVMVRETGHDSPVITQSVTLPVSGTLHPTEKHLFTDAVLTDETRQSATGNIQLFHYHNLYFLNRPQTKKQADIADINDVIPVLHTEKLLAEYPVLSSGYTDIAPELRQNIPVLLQQSAQHGMAEANVKAEHYFSYAFKMQGEYNEMIHIYRKQEQQFILETNSERLKRHLKANIRHGQRESIDIV
ncbi:hypothetical protein [Morganella psychrotolerans]|uniref:hypothetical protein n=1 Tax=Morganella psychrotolerans TaxID=368603 RepID=UPI0039AF52A5